MAISLRLAGPPTDDDASWIRSDRWDALSREAQEGFVPLCPEAVFEILSPSDRLSYLRRKCQNYLANGAAIVVLLDPERRAVEVFTPRREPDVREGASSITLDPVLPGFRLDLDALFR
jgi:Uma2 family endonuclease